MKNQYIRVYWGTTDYIWTHNGYIRQRKCTKRGIGKEGKEERYWEVSGMVIWCQEGKGEGGGGG